MNRLKELRQKHGDTQGKIANLIGVSEKTISRWEKEDKKSTIKSDKAEALAKHFGVSVGYLLGYDDRRTDIASSTFEKYEDSMQSTGDFVGYGLLGLLKGEKVQNTVIENLREINDYYGERALSKESAQHWSEEEKTITLQTLKSVGDLNIGRFLAGLMMMPNSLKHPIIDFITLETEEREAISKIIIALADNPVINNDEE